MSIISLAVPLPQIAYAEASIGATYSLAGSFTQGVAVLIFISTMDAAVQVSFDGVNDHVVVPPGNTVPSIIPFNFETNRMQMSAPRIFVKKIGAPSTGSLYVTGIAKS